MFAVLLKILPVLWPFFKEIFFGGDKDTPTDKNTKTKILFYLTVLLAAAAFYALHVVHQIYLEKGVLDKASYSLQVDLDATKKQLGKAEAEILSLESEVKTYREKERQHVQSEISVTMKVYQLEAELTSEKAKNVDLEERLRKAVTAAESLSKFRTGQNAPRSLVEHNQSVDTLSRLREEINHAEK